ncbi:hypothetical protein pb186bvf_019403 [Paramecium bursaria]
MNQIIQQEQQFFNETFIRQAAHDMELKQRIIKFELQQTTVIVCTQIFVNIVTQTQSYKRYLYLKLEWHGLLSIQYGIYGTGKFKFVLQFTKNFPLECPKIRLLQKLTHPLINDQGDVDVDYLLPNWKYGQDCMLYNLLGKFHDMFIDITILDSQESQFNPQASQLYLKDVGQFAEQIKREIYEHNKLLYDQREDFELKFTQPTNEHQEILDKLKQKRKNK